MLKEYTLSDKFYLNWEYKFVVTSSSTFGFVYNTPSKFDGDKVVELESKYLELNVLNNSMSTHTMYFNDDKGVV